MPPRFADVPDHPLLPDCAAYETLYVILNEEDSREYRVTPDGALIKLDNAATFNLGSADVAYARRTPREDAVEWLRRPTDFAEYPKYAIQMNLLTEHLGSRGREASLSMFRRFSGFDINLLNDALKALGQVYPGVIRDFYTEFY